MKGLNWSFVAALALVLGSCSKQALITSSPQDLNKGADTCPKSITPSVVFGTDDRIELWQIPKSIVRKIARSTFAVIEDKNLIDLKNGTTQFSGTTLQARQNVCASENFSQQMAIVHCSAALVGKDLVLSAGHCFSGQNECDHLKFVFDYAVEKQGVEPKSVPTENVYNCKSILVTKQPLLGDDDDYAVIQLDREVKDRTPLRMRRSGEIALKDKVYLLGYPLGIPLKHAGPTKVRSVSDAHYFDANLDGYIHNSGSPVFNVRTNRIEGVLVRGESDFVSQGSCGVSKVCPDDDKTCKGESMTRVKFALPFVPDVPDVVDDPQPQPSPQPSPTPGPIADPCASKI